MQYRQTINAMSSDHKNQCSRYKADEDAQMRVDGAAWRVLARRGAFSTSLCGYFAFRLTTTVRLARLDDIRDQSFRSAKYSAE